MSISVVIFTGYEPDESWLIRFVLKRLGKFQGIATDKKKEAYGASVRKTKFVSSRSSS